MMEELKSLNDIFIEKTDMIKARTGKTFIDISKECGFLHSRLSSIRKGKSSADKEMIIKLNETYPNVFNAVSVEKEIEAMKKEVSKMKEEVLQIKADYEALLNILKK